MRVLLTIALALFTGQVYADSRTVFVRCQFSDGEAPIYRFWFNDHGIERGNKPLEWTKWNASNGSWSSIVEDSEYNSNRERVMYEVVAAETRYLIFPRLYNPDNFEGKETIYQNALITRRDRNQKEVGNHSVPSVNAVRYEVDRLTGNAVKSLLSLPSGFQPDRAFKQRVTERVIATGRCEATAAPSPPPKPVTKF